MITIGFSGISGVQSALRNYPGKAQRACAIALNNTARLAIKPAEQAEMRRVFDNPVRYTLNSLYVTNAKPANLQAVVWFKTPARMKQHYLVPEVEGGPRKLKGFEHALGNLEYIPGRGAKLNAYGNISPGIIRQILSVLGKAEHLAGYSANITSRSRKRNKKQRDYVLLTSRHGKLPPGIYQRYQTGRGFGAKTKATFQDQSKAYQRGRTRNKISSVIRARGLKPIMVEGRTGHQVKPLLDFYGVAARAFNREFAGRFWATLNKYMSS